jgi:hypothetical protein
MVRGGVHDSANIGSLDSAFGGVPKDYLCWLDGISNLQVVLR